MTGPNPVEYREANMSAFPASLYTALTSEASLVLKRPSSPPAMDTAWVANHTRCFSEKSSPALAKVVLSMLRTAVSEAAVPENDQQVPHGFWSFTLVTIPLST